MPASKSRRKSTALPTPIPARCMNVREASHYLGATVWFVRTAVWEERLKAVKFGRYGA